MRKCSVCNGELFKNSKGQLECKSCGNIFALEEDIQRMLNEETHAKAVSESENILELAQNNCQKGNFDEAFYAFSSYLELNADDARAYWGKVLSKYGVLFETEKIGSTTVKKPTLNRMSQDSILTDEDYLNALKYATTVQKNEYEDIATTISQIQKQYMNLVMKEKPYDVFISFKATDENGKQTEDSSLAYEIYERLNSLGKLNVFFSRITLQEKNAGTEYEPYIYSALNTAKVMILVGTKGENITAQWVRNEWSRFVAQMAKDNSKVMIPVLKGMSKSELPDNIPAGNTMDYKGEESLAELAEAVLTITGKGLVIEDDDNERAISTLREKMKELCNQKDFKGVREVANDILDIDAEFGEAYYYLLLAQYKVSRGAELAELNEDWTESKHYKYAVRFADELLKNRLEAIKENYETRLEDERRESVTNAEVARRKKELEESFSKAKELIKEYRYADAKDVLMNKAFDHPEAPKYLEICNLGVEALDRVNISSYYRKCVEKKDASLWPKYEKALADRQSLSRGWVDTRIAIIAVIIAVAGFLIGGMISDSSPMMLPVIAGVCLFIAGKMCDRGLISIASAISGVLGLGMTWASKSSGVTASSGLLGTIMFILIILEIKDICKNKAYDVSMARIQHIFSQVESIMRKERENLESRYMEALGEEFCEKYLPKLPE